ncbi:hypothetical protein K1719_002559 [Acacia pycnantha]|nr:hypothetical protein K1719_002559 [Acacia pycnantha]
MKDKPVGNYQWVPKGTYAPKARTNLKGPKKRWSKFATIKQEDGGRVIFGGNQSGKIAGIGKVGNNDGPQIKDVYFVEGLCHNLLSVSQSTDKGNIVIFDSRNA